METQEHEETQLRAAVPIRQFGDPVLRVPAMEIDHDRIGSAEVQGTIDDMVASLAAAKGVGLAAPQIGLSQRLLIIKIPAMNRVGYGDVPETPLLVLINPVILEKSQEMRWAPEACLSIRTPDGKGVYEGVVERPERIVVRGYNRLGREITVEGDKLLSRAIQHEIDHLDGILFTDHIRELRDLRVYYPVDSDDPVLSQAAGL
ncbi:MAG: peptide deformylase [Chloroflexota bacterium]